MNTKRDYYEILGLERNASGEEIKRSYRKLAMQHHPDKNPGDHESEIKFKELAEAYEVLKDPVKKQRYDQFGHRGVDSTGFHGFDDVNDIFSHFSDIFGNFGGGSIFDDFFGGSTGRRQGRKQDNRGSDLKVSVKLTLEEIAEGVEKTIKFKKYITCTECDGTGAKKGSGYINCSSCSGTGEIRQVSRSIFGQFVNVAVCANCGGEGKIIKEPCIECKGDGRIKTDATIKVNIPAGVEQGNYIPLREQGNVGLKGGTAGNMLVFIEEEEHEFFVRDGDDIIYDLNLSFSDAALGADVIVPTLKGKSKLKIDSGTQPGKILRMKDKGIKHLNDYGRGDQLVRVNITVPTKLNSKEKELLKELGRSENFNPNGKNKSKKTDKKEAKSFFKGVFS
jgi:molecular chaperone DnaJ